MANKIDHEKIIADYKAVRRDSVTVTYRAGWFEVREEGGWPLHRFRAAEMKRLTSEMRRRANA